MTKQLPIHRDASSYQPTLLFSMSNRYAPLPNNPASENVVNDELEAAFDDSDDEENASESYPLNHLSTTNPQTVVPGTYDFNADYDYPPPGSPPGPSVVALPNNHGNSNGITSFTVDSTAQSRGRGWFRRTATAILPTHYVQRFRLGPRIPSGAVGGGTNMDGVFANVTAKPTRSVRIQDGTQHFIYSCVTLNAHRAVGDDTYIVPEDSSAEAPPSYASAQADSGISFIYLTRVFPLKLFSYQFPHIGRRQSMRPSPPIPLVKSLSTPCLLVLYSHSCGICSSLYHSNSSASFLHTYCIRRMLPGWDPAQAWESR
jgi:hypothetical protein